MKREKLDLSYLHNLDSKNLADPQRNTPMAKRATFVLFALFLFSFHKYTPYSSDKITDDSILHNIFKLYFFISNQVFGIVHEGGHGVCYILNCPLFMTALNGTIFQILFPASTGYYYYKKGNILAANIGIFFTGFTMHYTAWYISTSHQGAIVPASKSFLGKDGYHDFNYILDTLNILPYDNTIAGIVRFIAYLLMFYAVVRLYLIAFVIGEKQDRKNR